MLTIAAATEGGWACWPLLCKIGSSQREEGRVWTWIKCELLFTSCLHEPDWGLIAVLRHRHFKVGRMGPRSSSVTCPKSHNSPLVDSGLRLRPVCLEAQAFPILLSLVHPTLQRGDTCMASCSFEEDSLHFKPKTQVIEVMKHVLLFYFFLEMRKQ